MSTRDHNNPVADEASGIYTELTTLRERLDTLEAEVNGMTKEERSHHRAKQTDARKTLTRGETHRLVILESPAGNDGEQAVSKIEGIYTFLDIGDMEVSRGDVVCSRILDIGDNHAEAIALEQVATEGNDDN